MSTNRVLKPKNMIRAFLGVKSNDGHDAPILYVADSMKKRGIEVVYGGYDLKAAQFVDSVIEEGAHFAGISSYNGAHVEFFGDVRKGLDAAGRADIPIVGGGGATITTRDISRMKARGGVDEIFTSSWSGEDVVDYLLARFDTPGVPEDPGALVRAASGGEVPAIARFLSLADEKARLAGFRRDFFDTVLRGADYDEGLVERGVKEGRKTHVFENGMTLDALDGAIHAYERGLEELFAAGSGDGLHTTGFIGRGGSGKSTLIDELVYRHFRGSPRSASKLAILAIDPSSGSGGAFLKERVTYSYANDRYKLFELLGMKPTGGNKRRLFFRSVASRGNPDGLSDALPDMTRILRAGGYNVIIETSGTGQSTSLPAGLVDQAVFVTTPDMGGRKQVDVERMLEVPGVIVVLNKTDKTGSREIHSLLLEKVPAGDVFQTVASEHTDPGLGQLYDRLMPLMGAASHA